MKTFTARARVGSTPGPSAKHKAIKLFAHKTSALSGVGVLQRLDYENY
jgi:hypothetical protein